MYPILSDIGFFPQIELERVCQDGAMLGSIPDPTIPGYECLGGSLGHGLGVACGVALALKRQNRTQRVYCLMGDGELNEGSVWEALMFARHHQIGNLIIIIDANGSSMMGRCQDVLRLGATEPFSCFNCEIRQTDGHSVEQIYNQLFGLKLSSLLRPGVLIANTIKGKGVPELESDPLSHIRNISPDRVDELLKELP
jgi:transketolase